MVSSVLLRADRDFLSSWAYELRMLLTDFYLELTVPITDDKLVKLVSSPLVLFLFA